MDRHVFIGHDARERRAFNVCQRSMLAHTEAWFALHPISRHSLGDKYRRPTEERDGRLWDVISQAPMATDFSLARFWIPLLVPRSGWALYVDGDFLFRSDVADLFAQADTRYAVQVVKHKHQPVEKEKMDGRLQTRYPRKNWSSCMLFWLGHAGHQRLTMDGYLNAKTGLDLHSFTWLKDHEIGELTPDWNVLDGEPLPTAEAVAHCGTPGIDSVPAPLAPKAYHFTRGTPDMVRCAQPYENEWWDWLTEREYREWRRAA